MSKLIYDELEPISIDEAAAIFSSGDDESKSIALLRLAYFESDWKWVQEKCFDYLFADSHELRAAAVTSLGHLARLHKKIDVRRATKLLGLVRQDVDLEGLVEDAMDDIEMFAVEG